MGEEFLKSFKHEYPNNLSLDDLCEIYLKIIEQSKEEGRDAWNADVDRLIERSREYPDELKDVVKRTWRVNPDFFLDFIAASKDSGRNIHLEDKIGKTREEIGPIENSLMAKIQWHQKDRERENYIGEILQKGIRGRMLGKDPEK